MTSPVLALLALFLAGPAPWALSLLSRLRRTPRAAVVLWQAVALAAVLAALVVLLRAWFANRRR